MEERQRSDGADVKHTREQLQMYQKEYAFYKNRAQQLELKTSGQVESLSGQVRELNEKCKDASIRVAELEQENIQLVSQNRNLLTDMAR